MTGVQTCALPISVFAALFIAVEDLKSSENFGERTCFFWVTDGGYLLEHVAESNGHSFENGGQIEPLHECHGLSFYLFYLIGECLHIWNDCKSIFLWLECQFYLCLVFFFWERAFGLCGA